MTEQKDIKKNTIALIGFIVGILALSSALFSFFVGPFSEPPAIEEVVADKAVDIKNAIVAKIKGEKYKAPEKQKESFDIDKVIQITVIAGGLIALILGSVAFVNREDKRMCIVALSFGGAAIAFQYVVIALGAILFVILLAVVLNQMGLDF